MGFTMNFSNIYNRFKKAVLSMRYEHDEEVLEPPDTTLKILTLVREPGDQFGPRPAYRHHSGPCRPSAKEGTLIPFGHCAICGHVLKR